MHSKGVNIFREEDFLQLSGLQHYKFCRRQWALIHIENQWADNHLTVGGELMHDRAHNEALHEKRGNVIITRGMSIKSHSLGLSGKCDVLEFHKSPFGVTLFGWEGQYLPFPVEYKYGEPKENNCDVLQLCAQAMCLEEMLCCEIKEGALYYGRPKRREQITFTDDLRQEVTDTLVEMHSMYSRGHTPNVKRTKACNSCSLNEICLPVLMKKRSVKEYVEENL
ncbi:MAG: CRISPR-associated protein Cas4 [Clostridiales bacterium]|nr:CRISPR-associated protein Cas4 [Clostridiales bacterium]